MASPLSEGGGLCAPPLLPSLNECNRECVKHARQGKWLMEGTMNLAWHAEESSLRISWSPTFFALSYGNIGQDFSFALLQIVQLTREIVQHYCKCKQQIQSRDRRMLDA